MPMETRMHLLLTTFFLMIFTASLSAEPLKVDMGIGLWQHETSGSITSTLNQTLYFKDNLSTHKSRKNGYMYINIEHKVPILPNLRLEYTNLTSDTNNIEIGAHSTFLPIDLVARTNLVSSSLLMKQYDAIFFYNTLDEYTGITLDLGLDLKYLLIDYQIDFLLNSSESSVIPLAYVRGRIDTKANIGFETDVKYITDGSAIVYELCFKVDYTMIFIPVVHPGIELGYKVEQFTSKGEDSAFIGAILSNKIDSDIGFSGFYGGITVEF